MATPQFSKVHGHRPPGNFKDAKGQDRPYEMSMDEVEDFQALAAHFGIHLPADVIAKAAQAYAMDDNQGLVTTASIGVPVQFLQTWLPGYVRILTNARKIDELIGMTTVGNWEDEEIVQGILEPVGVAGLYGDSTNIPLSSYNANYERRSVVRFEKGFEVFKLEAMRMGRNRIDAAAEKRLSAGEALDIQRNIVGFVGYNGGNNRTYGLLNDPNLPSYVTVATGASSSTTWASKTFTEICQDIRTAAGALQAKSGDRINPNKVPTTLAVGHLVYQSLWTPAVYGAMSVMEWINKTYPLMRVESAPQLTAANGGANVMYLYAETVSDNSTDNSRVVDQLVPAKIMALGVQQLPKSFIEDFSCATAGALLKRPWALVRYTGI